MDSSWNEREAERRHEELLLDAVRGEPVQRAAARAELARRAGGARELRRFEARLERAREELEDDPAWSFEREERVIARVLAATTGSGGRAAARHPWRAWRWVAAAALVAGLGLLASRARVPHGATEALAATPFAGEPAVELAALAPAATQASVPLLTVGLAQARRDLVTTADARSSHRPAGELGADAPLELRLLEARAKGLREQRWDTWLKEVPLADLDPLSLALWCEVELDRFVLSGERPPAWKKAVAILERGLARTSEDEEKHLLAHALERAREYGLTGDAHGDVQVARLEPAQQLWTREWFEDLEAAGHGVGLAETGTWRAWVDWRGR